MESDVSPKMYKSAQKIEWKTQSKISCHYTWLLHDKNCPSRWRFLRSLLTARNTAAKRKEKAKNERRKKFIKIEKPKDVGHFFVQKRPVAKFWFLRMPEPKCRKMQAAMFFDYIKANFANIHPKKSPKCSKRCFSPKSPGGKGLMAW